MRSSLPYRFQNSLPLPVTVAFILLAILASCNTGGPTDPGPPVFSLSATTMVFSGPEVEEQISIRNLRSEPLEWQILSTTASWLKAEPAGGTINAGSDGVVRLRIDRRAVPVGTHIASLHIGAGRQSTSIDVTVQEFVAPRAVVTPRTVTIGPHEESRTLQIANVGGSNLVWALTAPDWVTLSHQSGSLSAGTELNVVVTPRRNVLAAGEHQGVLQLTSNGGTVTASFSVTIPAVSDLVFDPGILDFDTNVTRLSLTIRNRGSRSLDWIAQSGGPWIRILPSEDRLPPGMSQLLSVEISRAGLHQGSHQAPIHFTANGATSFLPVRAVVAPVGAPDPAGSAQIHVSPVAVEFGETTSVSSFRIQNMGQAGLDWSGLTTVPWISASTKRGHIAPGTHQDVVVQVSRSSLTAGTYQGFFQISSNGGSGTVLLSMIVSNLPEPSDPAVLAITPLSLDFGTSLTELKLKLKNTGGSELMWSFSSTEQWATTSTPGGRIAPGAHHDISVRVSRSGLAAGETYSGLLLISSNDGITSIPISVVGSPPTPPEAARIVLAPSAIDFGSSQSEQALTVRNAGGSTLTWSVSDSLPWATASKTSGSLAGGASEQILVRVSRAGLLGAGTYTGSLRFASNGGGTLVPVSVQVTATPAPKISASPATLDFGTSLSSLKLAIRNIGGASLSWSANPTVGWIRPSTPSGVVQAGAIQEVDVQVVRSSLVTAGTYQGQLQLSSNGGNLSIPVSLQVQATPPGGSGPTVDVRAFGAKGDGVADDAPAFKSAIEAVNGTGGTVVVPAGNYRLTAIYPSPHRPLDFTKKSNITIAGGGMENTFLVLEPGQYPGAANMALILKSNNITIKDLTIDMNQSQSTFLDEQSHGIRIASSSGIRIQRVRFQDSPADGVYLIGVGEPGEPWSEEVSIDDCHFIDLGRNGVSVQRGVRNLQIRGNTFERLADQSISAEPSGSGGISPRGILIENNVIKHTSSTWAVALGGAKRDDLLHDITFRGNHLQSASAYFTRVVGLTVEGNTFLGDPWHPPLRMEFINGGVAENNTLTGKQLNSVEGILQVVNEETFLTKNMSVRNNTLHVNSGSTGIYVRDPGEGVTVSGNLIFGSNGKAGIIMENLLSLGLSRSRFEFVSNQVRNFRLGILISTRGDAFSHVGIRSNQFDHNQQPATATTGILFSGTGAYQGFADLSSNTFGGGILTEVHVE